MAGKHRAVSSVARKVEPLPVKAAVKGVKMADRAGVISRTAPGRHSVDMRGKTPANNDTSPTTRRPQDSANPLNRVRGAQGTQGAKYKGKNSLTPTRASRTHYIRYIGNQDANNTGKLIGEWLLGVLIISISVPIQAANVGYGKTITAVMYRLTALTAVFFVLALMTNTKGGKTAVYAGLLIDLGIIFDAVHNGSLKGGANLARGAGLLVGGRTQPAADILNPVAPDNPSAGGLLNEGNASGGSNPAVPAAAGGGSFAPIPPASTPSNPVITGI